MRTGAGRDKTQVFLSELAKTGSVRKACRIANVTRMWVREQQLNEPEFNTMYADALDDYTDSLQETASMQALKGDANLLKYFLDNLRFNKNEVKQRDDVKPVINIKIESK